MHTRTTPTTTAAPLRGRARTMLALGLSAAVLAGASTPALGVDHRVAAPRSTDTLAVLQQIAPDILATSASTSHGLPRTLSEGYAIPTTVGGITMRPVGGHGQPAASLGGALRSYGQTHPDTETLLSEAAGTGAVRSLQVLRSAAAPQSFAFTTNDPRVVFRSDPSGVVFLERGGRVIGSLSAPWSRDATGAPVPTRFVPQGNVVVLVVEHRRASTVYPVVADPIPAVIALWGMRFVLGAVVGAGGRAYMQSRGAVCPWWANVWTMSFGCYWRAS